MNLRLEDKTVFISGSTSGIGLATARLLLEEGAKVIINGRSNRNIQEALERIDQSIPGAPASGFAADFRKPAEIIALIKRLPEIDILINNVGIYNSQSFFQTDDQEWLDQFEVNVMSGVRLSRALLPGMLKRGWGRIIFISSECATLVPADLISYSMTKTGLITIAQGLAKLTKGTGVTVNSILPGSTLSEGAEQFLADIAEKEGKSMEEVESDFFKEVRTSSLLMRFAAVEEIANTIVYYASPLSAATNGAAIRADGGSMGGLF